MMRTPLLRLFCKKVGIVLSLRDYAFDSRVKPAFHPEDVLTFTPVVKSTQHHYADLDRKVRVLFSTTSSAFRFPATRPFSHRWVGGRG